MSYKTKSAEHILKNLLLWSFEIWKIIILFKSARWGLLRKKLKLGQCSKIELSWNFFLFFIFLKKNFLSSRISKYNCRFWTAVANLLGVGINRFELGHQMAAGGAPGPPAPKSHNFQVWLCASFLLSQTMHITIGYQNLETRMTPHRASGNLVKKTKSTYATSKFPKT